MQDVTIKSAKSWDELIAYANALGLPNIAVNADAEYIDVLAISEQVW